MVAWLADGLFNLVVVFLAVAFGAVVIALFAELLYTYLGESGGREVVSRLSR